MSTTLEINMFMEACFLGKMVPKGTTFQFFAKIWKVVPEGTTFEILMKKSKMVPNVSILVTFSKNEK